MSILFYIILVLLFLFFGIFTALFFVFALDSILKGHDLPTSKRAIRYLVEIISKHKPDATTFYDLGCGRGTVVLTLKKKLPNLETYGIDNSTVRIFFAKLKTVLLRREVNLKKQDIFQTDLRNADIVYTYLWYDLMPLLEKKLQKELKHGAMIITNTSNFPTWKPAKIYVTYPKKPDFEKLFIYVKT